ncbi:hypothetical protein RND71_043531 [Anisodus tanguticus]|uniref:Rho GTPase n=1 Tax=Anisodus tanguticus TaxID=243964 RepID=A0AAE1UTK7_9SOLA|nr:hypothetical protein RND71_043531 [Anisodus tanguticus]
MKKNKEISRKFVLVGDGFCGKSTLIAAFYNRKFVHRYEPTIFETFTVNTDAYKKHVKLELWDTAGQEEFSRVRPLSYPEVDAIILCFSIDSRESSQNISETWLPEIKHFCSHKIPIVLVATKIDLRNKKTDNEKDKLSSLITTEEGLKLCTKIGASAYVECSAKLNIGVDEVFKTALKLTIRHPLFMKMDLCNLS